MTRSLVPFLRRSRSLVPAPRLPGERFARPGARFPGCAGLWAASGFVSGPSGSGLAPVSALRPEVASLRLPFGPVNRPPGSPLPLVGRPASSSGFVVPCDRTSDNAEFRCILRFDLAFRSLRMQRNGHYRTCSSRLAFHVACLLHEALAVTSARRNWCGILPRSSRASLPACDSPRLEACFCVYSFGRSIGFASSARWA